MLFLLACLSFWLPAAGAQGQTTASLAMSSAAECTQCHLLWLPEFEQPGAAILVPYQRGPDFATGRQHAESSDLMC